MDILKTATDWARSEVFSTSFFILAGILFFAISVGFWHLGKTELARAYVIPTSVAGGLLLIIGLGLFFTNIYRISGFETAYSKDASAFVASEVERVDATLKEYQNVVFKAVPFIIIIASFLLVFMDKPMWRASAITTIAMLVVILLIDGTAHGRIDAYKKQLELVEKE
jgi:hypothetical protein